jgi:hypothetical protein
MQYHQLIYILLSYSLPNTASAKGDGDLPAWFPPVVNLVGHAGDRSQVHDSGMRSFDLQCAVYNFNKLASATQSKSKEFTIRCFFDIGKRWESFQPPKARTLIHIVGQLVGYFQMGDQERPAVLITSYQSLKTAASIEAGPAPALNDTPVKPRFGPLVRSSPAKPLSPLTTPVSGRKSEQDFLGSSVVEEPIESSDLDPLANSSSSTGTTGESRTVRVGDDDDDDVLAESQRRGKKRRRVVTAKAAAIESVRTRSGKHM